MIRPEDYTIIESLVPATGQFHGDADGADVEGDADVKEVPTKCIRSITKLEALCQLAYIEFEGVSDGESVRRLLTQIKPKQLIVVHGSTEGTKYLTDYCAGG